MYEMQEKFGSEWSGFTPDISKPTDTPLETAIKRVIKRMIQPLPADRMSMAEVVSKFAELRYQYKPNLKSRDTSSSGNIRPSQSRGNGFHCLKYSLGTYSKKQGPPYVDCMSYYGIYKMVSHIV